MTDMTQIVRPDLHVAIDCPSDWTLIELDDGMGLRISDPTDPRVAVQITSDERDTQLDETAERIRNGIPTDATCEAWAMRLGAVDEDGQLTPERTSAAALAFSARDRSFVYRVIVAAGSGRRWTIRIETLQRKEWWNESDILRTILEGIVLL